MDCNSAMGMDVKTVEERLTCSYCKKTFSKISNKNKHIRSIHKEDIEHKNKRRMLCPVCPENQFPLKTYENLYKHAEEKHGISIKESIYNFSSKAEYEDWKKVEKLEVCYMVCRKLRKSNCSEIHYACNKSNTRGYQSNCKERAKKSGGSIKINGFCPSRIIVSENEKGEIVVRYQKTHLGHTENELRSQHLSDTEKNTIVEKLRLGIPTDVILEDAKKLERNNSLGRINMLKKSDINYLRTKHCGKKSHKDQLVAVQLKVNEWNANGLNYAFIFKNEGETHEILKEEDFAFGFMNATMEYKLKNFYDIICMDGTRCTDNKMHLTTMLIKDEKNAGFPVAFFLSNRADQQIQEIFLGALKAKLREEIKPNYFMTNDYDKYYKAWVKVMNNKPRRLLCTWHVMKNWDIQAGAKLKNLDLQRTIKVDLKKILNETDEEKFLYLMKAFCNKLESANESDFLNYLKRNYFQRNRTEMWAHCYRMNAAFNTNMSLDSLNNFLKNNQLKRRANVTVERLLDIIDELINFKTWHQILNTERTYTNNAESTKIEEGQYQLESSDDDDKDTIHFEEKITDNKDYGANEDTKRNVEIEDLGNFLKNLNKSEYTEIMGKIKLLRNEVENTENNSHRKRKMDKWEYYPSKKQHN